MSNVFDELRELKAQGRIKWDIDGMNGLGQRVSDMSKMVYNQQTAAEPRLSPGNFETVRRDYGDMRSQLNYMQAYANFVKDSDPEQYRQITEHAGQIGSALDSMNAFVNKGYDPQGYKEISDAKTYLAANAVYGGKATTDEVLNKSYFTKEQQDALKKIEAVELMRSGKATSKELAQKYGIDQKELEDSYRQTRAFEKQEELEQRYDGLSMDELVKNLFDPDALGNRIYKELTDLIGSKPEKVSDFDKQEHYKQWAAKYGLKPEDIEKIYLRGSSGVNDHHYDSKELSEQEREYIYSLILEKGTADDLEAIEKILPQADIYNNLRYGIKDVMEEKQEERYYYDVLKKYPDAQKIIAQGKDPYESLRGQDFSDLGGSALSRLGDVPEMTDIQKQYAAMKADGVDFEKFEKYGKRIEEKKKNAEKNSALSSFVSSNPFAAGMMSLASIPMNMGGSVIDLGRIIHANIDKAYGGDGWYDPKATINYKAQTIRGTTTAMMDDAIDNETARYWAKQVYNAGMSGGDMLLAAAANAIPVVGQGVANAMFFSSAGVNAANEVIENGGSLEQATKSLIANGAAELVFERISLDKLEALAVSGSAENAKEYFKNILKQAFVEGSEEFNTSLANRLSDALINGGNSSVNREIRKLMAQGMSSEEAQRTAYRNWAQGVFDDFVGGALTGGLAGGAAGAKSAVNANTVVDVGGHAVTKADFAHLLSNDNAEAMSTAEELVKELGVEKVIKAAEKSDNKKTRETAKHFEELYNDGRLDEKDAAALLIKTAQEQSETNTLDAIAKAFGEESVTEHRTRLAQVEEHNKGFDFAGNRVEEGESGVTSSFGAAHPNGVTAQDSAGRNIEVKGVESSVDEWGTQGRTVTVTLGDGTTADASEISLNDPDYQRLLNLTPNYETLGARALLSSYESAKQNGMSVDSYKDMFSALYDMGQRGMIYEGAMENPTYRAMAREMGDTAFRAAIEAGNNDAEIAVKTRARVERRVRVPGIAFGKSRVSAEPDVKIALSDDARTVLQAVADKTGKDIVLTNALADDDRGVYSENKIYLNANQAEHVMVATALHEAVHNMAVYSPEDYRVLQKFVVNYIVSQGKNLETELDALAAVYGKDAPTEDILTEELVCKTVESLASDEKALRTALGIKENQPLKEKIAAIFKRIADAVEKFFKGDKDSGIDPHNQWAQTFLDDVQALRDMAEMVSRGFDSAKESERKSGAKESGVRFSKDSFEVVSIKKQIRAAEDQLNDMDVVANVSSDLTFKQYKTETKKRLKSVMKEEIIVRSDFGEIVFSDKTIDKAIKYANTEAEKAAILAAPSVIKNGIKIYSEKNHKGRGFPTTTFAAPISIDGKRGNMAVVIKQTDINRYSAHRILLPDGTMFVLDKEKDTASANVGSIAEKASNPRPTITAVSNRIIAHDSQKSNTSEEKNISGSKSKDDTIYTTDDGDLDFDYYIDNHILEVEDNGEEFPFFEDEEGAEDKNRMSFEKLAMDDPDQAVYAATHAAMRTLERGLKGSNSVKLEDADYEKIARRAMRDFGIKEKLNDGMTKRIAADIEDFVRNIGSKSKADFSTHINGLMTLCKGYLERSGDIVRNEVQQELRDFFKGYSSNHYTLLVTPYEESEVLDGYDGDYRKLRRALAGYFHVGREIDHQKTGHYKKVVYMEELIKDLVAQTGRSFFPEGYDTDAFTGWRRLPELIEFSRGTFVNTFEGYGQNIESAAMEMAMNIAGDVMREKADAAIKSGRSSRQEIVKLTKDQKSLVAEQRALRKARERRAEQKYNRLKRRAEAEHLKRELAEEELDAYRLMAKDDVKSLRRQYLDNRRARNNLEAIRRQMNKLRTMITNPTNEKFIPPEILHNTTFLNAVEALGEGIVLNRRSQIAAKMQTMVDHIKSLRAASEKYDGDFETAFDAEFAAELESLTSWLRMDYTQADENGNVKITRETLDNFEIERLRQTVDEIVYRIENARKLLLRQDGITAREASDSVIRQTRELDPTKAKKIWAGASQLFLNPLRAVNHLSGFNEDSELRKLFYEINEGQRKSLFWQMGVEKEFTELVSRYEKEYKSACSDIVSFDYTAEGKGYKVEMTRMQALQVLMTWKRESRSSMNHMKRGGIRIADPKKVAKGKGKAWENSRSVPVSSDLINQIIHGLDKFESEYLKTAENYFNRTAKDAINEVFMVTRHREIARSEYYIPVEVDDDFKNAELEGLKYDFTIEGAGSYKHITPGAPQPILIESLNSVIDRHIKQTGKLYGLDIPLINFKRMFKGTTSFSSGTGSWFQADSVRKALGETFGEESVKFLEDTITELEGDKESQKDRFSSVSDFLYRTRVRTSLVGNLGVVIKQAASYPAAGLYLSGGDLTKGLAKFFAGKKDGEHTLHFYQKTIEEIDRYTAQHYIRRKGMSVEEVSTMLKGSKLSRNAPAALNPVKWIQGMDCLTTAALWEATKANIDRQYKKAGKETGGEEYFKDVAALYDKVIEDTQPMYDALHRSEFQKNPSTIRKFLFPFKTQPMQNMGILADAAGEFAAKRDKESAKKLAKALSSQLTSNLVFALMTFLAAWSRHRDDRYKDENDEITFNSFMREMWYDMFTNAVNTAAPIGGEWGKKLGEDIYDSIKSGKTPWSGGLTKIAKALELSIVNDWFDKVKRSATLLENQLNGIDKSNKNPVDLTFRVLDVPGNISEIFGIPYNNISTIFKGFANRFKDGEMYGLVNNKGELKTDHITTHIIKAYDSGNRKKGDELKRMWEEQLKSDGKIKNPAEYIDKKLVEGITDTDEIKKAAEAELGGNYIESKRLKTVLTDKGLSEDVVTKAVTKAKNRMTPEKEDSGEQTEKPEYTQSDAFNALKNGEDESYGEIVKYLAQRAVDKGTYDSLEVAEDKVMSKLRGLNYTRPLFEELDRAYDSGDKERLENIKKQLLNVFGTWESVMKAYEKTKKER